LQNKPLKSVEKVHGYYTQDLTDLQALPSYVELPEAPFAFRGHRRRGKGR
jgi:hypothetical protein